MKFVTLRQRIDRVAKVLAEDAPMKPKRKKTMHYSWKGAAVACNVADWNPERSDWTHRKNRVTCKNCKRTRAFRGEPS